LWQPAGRGGSLQRAVVRQVRTAVEMRAVFSDPRPNCLIIDEIDGAMSGVEGQARVHACASPDC
jgi:hypothetical protein